MCWMCFEKGQSAHHPCYGCGKTFEKSELHVYDIHKEWGQLVEWIETKQRIVVFCANCKEAMNNYRESTRAHVGETEPSGWTIPENGVPVSRYIDRSDSAIPVGIHNLDQTLGISCAQRKYGINATEEILQGFVYHDDEGHQIRRLTLSDTDETVRCDKCWLPLWQCNAREVSR
jgi:hypothetical protein